MSDTPQPQPPRFAWEEAEAEGFDMSLIEDNLRKTPWQRMRDHDRAPNLALKLRKAMQEHNEQRAKLDPSR
jgi:hypothetical protein